MSTTYPLSSVDSHYKYSSPFKRDNPSYFKKMQSIIPTIVNTTASYLTISEENRSKITSKVWNTAKSVFNVLLGLLLYRANNTAFVVGLFLGIIRNKEVDYSIMKINNVWKTQPFNTFILGGFGSFLGGAGSVLSLPMTGLIGSILYAAHLGSYLTKRAEEIQNKKSNSNHNNTENA